MKDIYESIKVLDDGHVRLIDHMGSDSDVANAARVSYAKGTKTLRKDVELLRYLMRHGHYSPFAMCQVKIGMRLPIFVANQLTRHDRFHFNFMSARYSEMPKEKWEPHEFREQGGGDNKQAGTGVVDAEGASYYDDKIKTAYGYAEFTYNELMLHGLCREQARTVLPMGQYTECFTTATLGDWMSFLRKRMDAHAQAEMQEYANAIFKILNKIYPESMAAFLDYQHKSVTFSGPEMNMLEEIIKNNINLFDIDIDNRVQLFERFGFESKLERKEFLNKIKRIYDG